MAVRAGAPKPDISTPEAFKDALLAAKSVGYSQGPSGVHFMSVMARLGIADQIKAKGWCRRSGQRVGALIAKGDAEIGVQQITELLQIPGIDFVGPLPKELQATSSMRRRRRHREGTRSRGRAVKFSRPNRRCPIIKKVGLEPA